MNAINVISVPCLQDNYIHILRDADGNAAITDPGEAAPALRALASHRLTLAAVLVTHRHADHIGGLPELLAAHPAPVYAPANCGIPDVTICSDGDSIPLLGAALRVIATPGHTLEHIAYAGAGIALTGDTLFIAGCGRVFEGSMLQMHDSLMRLAQLPDETRIYCGHDYTRNNLRFAAAVEPNNAAIAARLQQLETDAAPTHSDLTSERQINPFLRLTDPAVIAAAQQHGADAADSVSVFSALRRWKDNF